MDVCNRKERVSAYPFLTKKISKTYLSGNRQMGRYGCAVDMVLDVSATEKRKQVGSLPL